MARFQIIAHPYQKHCDSIRSISDNLKVNVIDIKRLRKPPGVINKYTYEVIFGAGSKAEKLHFIIENTDLPMTKALWDKQLLLSIITFYKDEKELDELTLVKNAGTGAIVFQADGIYSDGLNQDVYGDETRNWE
jgi:hypothetical protein